MRQRTLLILASALLALGCTPRKTARGVSIAPQPPAAAAQIPAVPKHQALHTAQDDKQLLQQLQQLNKQANAPTFGLIGGFYQLPVTHPAGALWIEHDVVSRSFASSQKLVALQQGHSPYAVVPLETKQAQALEASMQQLLDAGVQLLQISTADALSVMRAEQQALQQQANNRQHNHLPWSSILPPNVTLLISVQSGQGEAGPTLVGRVIDTTKGRLLALRSQPDVAGNMLGNLLLQLVHDTLQRLTKQPASGTKHSTNSKPPVKNSVQTPPPQPFTCPCLQSPQPPKS